MPSKLLLRPLFRRVLPSLYSKTPFLQSRLLLRPNPVVPLCVITFSTRSGSETMGGPGQRVSKSLIDDEAELSDWVSGLSSNSFKKTRLYSDTDDGDRNVDRWGTRGGAGRGRGGSGSFLGRRNNSESGSNRGSGNNEFSNRRGGASGEFGRGGKFGDRMEKRKSSEGFLDRGANGRNQNRKDTSDGNRGVGMKRGVGNTGKRGIVVTDDEDMEEDEDEDKGYASFKGLIDSDDSNNEEDEEEEEIESGGDQLFENEKVSSQSRPSSPGEKDSYLSESRFDQCSISPLTLKGVKDAGYEKMTLVQEATLPVILKGQDVMAKAKTGTGKTVAFLLPAIEHVVKLPSPARDGKCPPIYVLVICPTRELATQASAEAKKLLKYHPSIGVQVVIGGTRLTLEQKRMQANPCQILVATPGRLKDHIENTAGFATRLMGVRVLVLDEADHLLDMGFRRDIERIVAAVPKQRQTLLFSATIPQEVRQICHIALKRDHEFINTVQEGSEDTHAQVRQMQLVAPLNKHFSLLYTMLINHIADDVNYKVLVFCTTAMVTRLVASLLGELKLNVREIHSRKPQSYRTRISDEFRKSKGLILVTSDVSARGVDYPDVTLVVQIGVPADKQQYIHRLGRTGRKGKEGQGILVLAPWEEYFLSNVKDLPIAKAPELLVDPDTRKKVERALSNVEMKNKEAAYQAWLGYYNSNKNVGRDKNRLVELANEFSRSMGLGSPPTIPKLILGKMGLKNVAGLRSK